MVNFDFPGTVLDTDEKIVRFNSLSRDEKLNVMWEAEIKFYSNELRLHPDDKEIIDHLRKIYFQSEWRRMKGITEGK